MRSSMKGAFVGLGGDDYRLQSGLEESVGLMGLYFFATIGMKFSYSCYSEMLRTADLSEEASSIF